MAEPQEGRGSPGAQPGLVGNCGWDAEILAQAIVNAVRQPFLVLDRRLHVVSANHSFYATFEVQRDETIGRPLEGLGDRQWNIPRLSRLLKAIDSSQGGFADFEVGHDFPQIGYRTISLNACRVRTVADSEPLILLAFEDVTKRREAEDEGRKLEAKVQHAQKLESLGILAGGIAHDFNNLLVGVLGNAELALAELSPASGARRHLENLVTAARRAADLTKQMLAYSGKGKFVITRLNLNEVIEEMAHLLRLSISKTVVTKFDLSDDLPAIEGDVTQIRQVIMNLVLNAGEAIGQKSGLITVNTGVMEADSAYLSGTHLVEDLPEGYYAYVEVSDSGSGMDAETLGRIFDPFFTTKFTGRGLGLAVVLGIVRGHRGALKVYSQPKQGTTFKVLFPCARAQAEGALPESAAKAMIWRADATILAVDDEETVLTVAKQLLERHGLTVLTARDGREALKVFREHGNEIDAVLLDLTMPHLDGEETFRELRRLRPDLRTVLMSGYNEQDITNRFAGKGLAGFVQKPFAPGMLVEGIRSVLERSPDEQSPGTGSS